VHSAIIAGRRCASMIDTESGTVVLDGLHAIGPTLTRSAFVASPLGRKAKSIGVAKEWPRLFLQRHEVFGDACTVLVAFHGERLESVELTVVEARTDAKAGAFDVKAARAAKRRFDAWLASKVGAPPYEYAWGIIEAVYDPRSASSGIFVVYALEDRGNGPRRSRLVRPQRRPKP
jgi:hypothetical protein